MAKYDLISKTALLKHLDMAIECKDCPRNANKELYECVHNSTPQRCTCSEIAQICIRITDFEVSTDVQPIRHGRWKYYKNNGIIDTYICTNCQGKVEMAIDVEPSKFKYCPNCGARMDGDKE